jgi:hypothetical protein
MGPVLVGVVFTIRWRAARGARVSRHVLIFTLASSCTSESRHVCVNTTSPVPAHAYIVSEMGRTAMDGFYNALGSVLTPNLAYLGEVMRAFYLGYF